MGLLMGLGLGLLIASVAQDTTAQIAYPGTMVMQWLSTLWEALLIHLMIAFPEGRLGTQTKRWFVAAAYIFFGAGLFEPPDLLTAVVYPLFLIATVGLIVRRWWLGGSARRESRHPSAQLSHGCDVTWL